MSTTETPEQTEADGREPPLGYYLDRPVQGATLQITGTGASLDKGLAMPDIALDPGATVDIVLRCKVTEHRHEYSEDDDCYQLVNRLKAEACTIADEGEVASEALDTAEAKIAERKSEAERRRREEAGELPLFDANGQPEQVGDVLDNVLDIAEQAETTGDWRDTRQAELQRWKKDALAEHLTGLGCADVGGMLKAELVAEILEWEEAERG